MARAGGIGDGSNVPKTRGSGVGVVGRLEEGCCCCCVGYARN